MWAPLNIHAAGMGSTMHLSGAEIVGDEAAELGLVEEDEVGQLEDRTFLALTQGRILSGPARSPSIVVMACASSTIAPARQLTSTPTGARRGPGETSGTSRRLRRRSGASCRRTRR